MDNRPKDILIKGLSSVQTVTAVEGAVPQMALFLSTQYHLALWGRAQPYDNNNKKNIFWDALAQTCKSMASWHFGLAIIWQVQLKNLPFSSGQQSGSEGVVFYGRKGHFRDLVALVYTWQLCMVLQTTPFMCWEILAVLMQKPKNFPQKGWGFMFKEV